MCLWDVSMRCVYLLPFWKSICEWLRRGSFPLDSISILNFTDEAKEFKPGEMPGGSITAAWVKRAKRSSTYHIHSTGHHVGYSKTGSDQVTGKSCTLYIKCIYAHKSMFVLTTVQIGWIYHIAGRTKHCKCLHHFGFLQKTKSAYFYLKGYSINIYIIWYLHACLVTLNSMKDF